MLNGNSRFAANGLCPENKQRRAGRQNPVNNKSDGGKGNENHRN